MTHVSRDYLDNIIQSMTDMLIVLQPDRRIERVNQAALDLLGYSESELVGQTIETITELQTAQQLAKTQTLTRKTIEAVYKTKDGREIPVSLSSSAMTDRQGALLGFVYVAQDITDRKQADAELRKHIEKLTILQRVDSELNHKLHVPYVLEMALDAAMRFSGASAGAIELVEEDTIYSGKAIGSYPVELMQQYPRPVQGITARVLSTKQAERLLDAAADADYVAQIAATRALICVPLISQDRAVGVLSLETPRPHYFTEEVFDFLKILTSRIAVAIDNAHLYELSQTQLTELQALYERVSNLEQIKTDMIRIAAHDLRNPLAVINGFVSLMRETNLDERQQEFVKLIDGGTQRMRKIVDDILSLQRIEAMQESLIHNTLNLTELVKKIYHEHSSEAASRMQDYRSSVQDKPLVVLGDAPQLREAFANLIGNAIKYTPEHKRIEVCLSEKEGEAVFEVEDEGYGIPEKMQKDLFRPFYRARTRETRDIDGTGLGLHLVKNIVERHGGQIIFHSVYGQGSTFGFRLPLKKEIDLFGDTPQDKES